MKQSENTPKMSTGGKTITPITRRRSFRESETDSAELRSESNNPSSDQSLSAPVPPALNSPSASTSGVTTSLKIRIPALNLKPQVSIAQKQAEGANSAREFKEGAEAGSGRPSRSTRLRAPKLPPSVVSESSSSLSGLVTTEDDSMCSSEVNVKMQIDEVEKKPRQRVSGRNSHTGLPLKNTDLKDDASYFVKEAPYKRRRLPTLRKSESDFMAAEYMELTPKPVRPRRKNRANPARNTTKKSSSTIPHPDPLLAQYKECSDQQVQDSSVAEGPESTERSTSAILHPDSLTAQYKEYLDKLVRDSPPAVGPESTGRSSSTMLHSDPLMAQYEEYLDQRMRDSSVAEVPESDGLAIQQTVSV